MKSAEVVPTVRKVIGERTVCAVPLFSFASVFWCYCFVMKYSPSHRECLMLRPLYLFRMLQALVKKVRVLSLSTYSRNTCTFTISFQTTSYCSSLTIVHAQPTVGTCSDCMMIHIAQVLLLNVAKLNSIASLFTLKTSFPSTHPHITQSWDIVQPNSCFCLHLKYSSLIF